MTGEHKIIPLQVIPAGVSLDLEDMDLARALVSAAPWAPGMAWNRFAPMVYGMVLRQFGNPDDAEDLTQEIFYRFFGKVRELRKLESLRSYLVSFTIRTMKWEVRKRRAGRWLSFFADEDLPEIPDTGMDPAARDVLRRFYLFLGRMNTRDRMVYSLRHVESMNLEEIAKELGISLSTVKRTYERASSRVARWMESEPGLASFFAERGCRRDG